MENQYTLPGAAPFLLPYHQIALSGQEKILYLVAVSHMENRSLVPDA